MKTIVTGASGFIGTALVDLLTRRGHQVVAVSRSNPPPRLAPTVAWHKPDLLANSDWANLLGEVDCIYHLAWSNVPQTSNADPIRDASDNILGTLRLLEMIRKVGRSGARKRFIFPSSGGTVYGKQSTIPVEEGQPTRPTCAYGVSKLAIEKYITFYTQLGCLDGVALRISNPFGPNQRSFQGFGVIPTFLARALRNEPIMLYGDGSIIRDFLFIDDLVEAMVVAGETRGTYDVYNIGSGVGHSLNEVIAEIETQLGCTLRVTHTPHRDFDVPLSVLDISRARRELHWSPRVQFRDGIAMTVRQLQVAENADFTRPRRVQE